MKTIVSKLIITLMISCCLSYTNATFIQEEQENTLIVQPSNRQKPIDPEIIFTSDFSLKILEEEPSNLCSLAKLSKKTHAYFKPQIQTITWAYNHFQSQLLNSQFEFTKAIHIHGFKNEEIEKNANRIFHWGFVKHILDTEYPISVVSYGTATSIKINDEKKKNLSKKYLVLPIGI